MHKGDIDGDEADRFPHAAGELSASSPIRRIGENVIPFPCRALPPRPAAARSLPSPDLAAFPFEPLGAATAAVIMRLRSARPSVKVLSQADGEEDRSPGES